MADAPAAAPAFDLTATIAKLAAREREIMGAPTRANEGERWSYFRRRLQDDLQQAATYEVIAAELDGWAAYIAQLQTQKAQLLDSLLAVEWAGTDMDGNGDYCPNCGGAEKSPDSSDGHYTGCELRDSLDLALGVKSPRIERAHG